MKMEKMIIVDKRMKKMEIEDMILSFNLYWFLRLQFEKRRELFVDEIQKKIEVSNFFFVKENWGFRLEIRGFKNLGLLFGWGMGKINEFW